MMKHAAKFIFVLSSLLLLAACGGGGSIERDDDGGSTPTTPTDPVPTEFSIAMTIVDQNDQASNQLDEDNPLTVNATVTDSNGNVVAACIGSETARVCLETGRWPAETIYYPKGDDNVQGWADSTVQAAADLIEQRFWS